MKRTLITAAAVAALSIGLATSASAFSLSFSWAGLKLCNTGNPNVVGSPAFHVGGVPKGTTKISLYLHDNDAPDFNHGGGTVAYSGGTTLAGGAFRYQSPCPPGGHHHYVWSATAMDASGKVLGKASASKMYP